MRRSFRLGRPRRSLEALVSRWVLMLVGFALGVQAVRRGSGDSGTARIRGTIESGNEEAVRSASPA
ncbi:MAG TPA: hypothetical protein VKR21_18830 [Solirubrobacteraceae bacterium]|nr:hypothetical protein [Solirubrobacteraceae bacterium]